MTPGLSEFADNPEAAGESTKELLDFALETFQSLNAGEPDPTLHFLPELLCFFC